MALRICPLHPESIDKAAEVIEGMWNARDGQEILYRFGMYPLLNGSFPHNGDAWAVVDCSRLRFKRLQT